MMVISDLFELGHCDLRAIKPIDQRMFLTEARALFPGGPLVCPDVEPYDIELKCLMPREAEAWFLEAYNEVRR